MHRKLGMQQFSHSGIWMPAWHCQQRQHMNIYGWRLFQSEYGKMVLPWLHTAHRTKHACWSRILCSNCDNGILVSYENNCANLFGPFYTHSRTHTCYALSWSHDNFILFLYLFSVLLFSPLVYRGTHTHTHTTSSHIIYLPHLFCLCRIVDVSVEKLLLYC